MAKSLSLIFWGLLLVFVDLRLDAFDVLPDVVGYVLAAIGAGRLSARRRASAPRRWWRGS